VELEFLLQVDHFRLLYAAITLVYGTERYRLF